MLFAGAIAFGLVAIVATPMAKATAPAPRISLIQNGTFDSGMTGWQTFALPTSDDIVASVSNGVLEFYRKATPEGQPAQAVVLQPTGVGLPSGSPVDASFDLGNSSNARKRVGVLIHDLDFSDLTACTFWLAPNTAPATYTMRAFTTEAWTNATISFYAASVESDGGFYQIDNVSLQSTPGQLVDRTDCVDPTVPAPPPGVTSGNLLTNGSFSTGTTSGWTLFGQIVGHVVVVPIASASFTYLDFYRPIATPDPAGVVLQPTNTPVVAGERVTARFVVGGSNGVRRRVTAILHDLDFTDLVACSFWAAPGLHHYTVTGVAGRSWTNLTFSLYAATPGDQPTTLFTGAAVSKGGAVPVIGTQCIDEGSFQIPNGGEADPVDATVARDEPAQPRQNGWTLPTLRPSAIDVVAVTAGAIHIEARIPPESGGARIEVSLDGETWQTLAVAPPLAERFVLDIDPALFARQLVYWRLVID